MAKLKGAKKTAFLKRMQAGRDKAKRKTLTKRRKSSPLKRRNKTKSMAKRSRRSRAVRYVKRSGTYRRTDLKGIFKRGILGEAVKGIGSGAIAGLVLNRVAPQYSLIGSTGAGFLGGGLVGAVSSLFVNGGLNQLTGMFGGSPAQTNGANGV